MSWLRSSPLRASFSRQPSKTLDATTKCDPSACYESFCKHWQQAEEIILRSQGANIPSHDDVLGVVSHLEHLATLLLLEVRQHSRKTDTETGNGNHGLDPNDSGPDDFMSGVTCLEHLLSKNLLEKLFEWGSGTGKYLNAVRLEQMKLYSLLVTHSGQQLLSAEPFLRPLLKLLNSFRNDLLPPDVEGRLVCLLGQLCVVLMQNTKFVDLFFYPAMHSQDNQQSSFIPVTLLLSYVHLEGYTGQQARDALLLCAALSAKNLAVAEFVAHRSNVCPVLATGLSGLYCLLPRFIDVTQPDWHRLTPDDVNDIQKLGLFMNSLEFCNAVVQVSHPLIQQQLLDFLYQGFLLPVMGPALLQNGVDEQVAAIAYFELVLRSVSEPGLLKSLVKFLMDNNYDGNNIVESIMPLVDGEPRLSIVTISLLETLVDLNCEDLMLEMVLKYLISGNHLMVSHRWQTLDCDLHCKATSMFLDLSPECCIVRPQISSTVSSSRRNSNASIRKPSISSIDHNMHSLTSIGEQSPYSVSSRNSSQTSYAYGLHMNESLYGNYHAYLCEARRKIGLCKNACSKWSSKYDTYTSAGSKLPNDKIILTVVKDFQLEHSNLIKETSFTSESNDHDEGLGETMSSTHNTAATSCPYSNKEEDSLPSIGESSGYDSFKYKSEDHHSTPEEEQTLQDHPSKDFAEESFWKSIDISDGILNPTHEIAKRVIGKDKFDLNAIDDVNIGPLLSISLNKLGRMLENDVYVNLRLTGLITRLAVYPLPLIRSFLLCPWIVHQPSVTSLYQILVSLKQKIDESVRNDPDTLRLVEEAQQFLIDREIRLSNARKNAIESIGSKSHNTVDSRNNVALATNFTPQGVQYQDSSSQPSSGNWEMQPSSTQPMSILEPFKRNEPKRKSLSSFTSMFSRKISSGASGIAAIYEYITSGTSNSSTNLPQIESSYSGRTSEHTSYSSYSEDNLWQSSSLRRTVINAVILDEWLRELGALAQEHVLSSVTDLVNSTNNINNNNNCEIGASAPAQTKIL